MTGQKGDKNIHPILKELLEIKSARDDYDLDVVFAHSAIGCGRFWGEFAGELASFPSSIDTPVYAFRLGYCLRLRSDPFP